MEELKFYAIQKKNGEWYRNRGSGYRPMWIKELKKAKIYANVGQARARITMFMNEEDVIHDLVEFTLTGVRVLDETERLEKAKLEKQRELDAREVRRVENELRYAQDAMKRAQEKIASLKKR